MTQTLAAQLDELMGKNRNVAPGENHQEPRFDDPDVCKFYLAGYCPHEMFTNTKSDLGNCHKSHDIGLKQQYSASSRFEKMGYEEDFLAFLQKMQGDMDKKIRRHVDRLRLTQGGAGGPGDDLTSEGRLEKKMSELTEKINEYLAKAEALGAEGKVDESVEAIRVADRYKTERESARKTLNMMMGMEEQGADSKPMEVCMVCGCFLIVGDAPQRIEEHMNGKQHVGFARVRSTVEELLKRREEKRETERAEREARRAEAEAKRAARDAEKVKEEPAAAADTERRSSKDPDTRRSDRDRDRGDRDRRDRGDRDRGADRDRRDRDRGDRDRDRDRDRRHDDRTRGSDRRDRGDRDRGGDRDRDRDRRDRDRGGDRRDRDRDRDRGDRDRRRSRHERSGSRERSDRKRSRHESPKEEEAEDRLERPLKSKDSPDRNGTEENGKGAEEAKSEVKAGVAAGGEKEEGEESGEEGSKSPSKEGTTEPGSPAPAAPVETS